MVDYYPPWGFYYKVELSISKNKGDVRFQTVSGLSVEYDMEEFKEGGENRFTHKLPVRTKYADLVLKRGMLTDSSVTDWFLTAFPRPQFLAFRHRHYPNERKKRAIANLERYARHPQKVDCNRPERQRKYHRG